VNPDLFRADLEAKPGYLTALADALEAADPWAGRPAYRRVLLLGMGSSRYAARVAAHRLRVAGVDAVADHASAPSWPATPDTLVVAISASGGSRETIEALHPYAGTSPIAALTNTPGSAVTVDATLTVDMLAGPEASGIACRSFQHTLALLMSLVDGPTRTAATVRAAAVATADLLARRDEWLPEAAERLDGPNGVYALAPAARISSADQSALMFRETPRRPATGCETGDWSHVDVYLTKTLDYRALLFPGSRYDPPALYWLRDRGSTVLAVGADIPTAAQSIRYPHDSDADVALLTETLVAELIAAHWWQPTDPRPGQPGRHDPPVPAAAVRAADPPPDPRRT
jgi:fructoselysine-6-P-deglycase FrlB-like protein